MSLLVYPELRYARTVGLRNPLSPCQYRHLRLRPWRLLRKSPPFSLLLVPPLSSGPSCWIVGSENPSTGSSFMQHGEISSPMSGPSYQDQVLPWEKPLHYVNFRPFSFNGTVPPQLLDEQRVLRCITGFYPPTRCGRLPWPATCTYHSFANTTQQHSRA